jgi:soluble lytic murein transglycosylase-like protein
MRHLFVGCLIFASVVNAHAEDGGGRDPDARREVADPTTAAKITVAPTLVVPASSDTGEGSSPSIAHVQSDASKERCDSRLDDVNLRALVAKEAAQAGVDSNLALTILSLESSDGVALNSRKGARGPMQLMPDTAARYGVQDICDPGQNVHGAMLFLKDLTAQFQGNMLLIAAAYNAGPDRVYDARGVPAIAETVRYVASAANRYYGLSVFVDRRKRRLTGSHAIEPRVADGASTVSQPVQPHQEWIGGSVLYVGGSESGETQ